MAAGLTRAARLTRTRSDNGQEHRTGNEGNAIRRLVVVYARRAVCHGCAMEHPSEALLLTRSLAEGIPRCHPRQNRR